MKRLLFIGIRMDRGGTEKALLSLLGALDPNRFDVSLLLAEHDGPWQNRIPNHVTVLPPIRNGSVFTLSRKNALSVLAKLRFRGKERFLAHHSEKIWAVLRGQSGAGESFFIELMKAACPLFSEEHPMEEYDAVIAFSGDRTMFYLCEKVCCRQKYAFMHFDWRHPMRNHDIYHSYFKQCRSIFSVSESCSLLLRREFPDLADRFKTFYNVISPQEIKIKVRRGNHLPERKNTAFRILSVMRICHQKGADRIPAIIKRLCDKGIEVEWYLVGDGSQAEINRILQDARRIGVDKQLFYVGPSDNPYTMMSECDLFVLPSRYEGMPITVEEGKILGIPMLCTDYLSAKEQLQGGFLGKIVSFSDEDIAAGIAELVMNQNMLTEYRRRLAGYHLNKRDVNHEMMTMLGSDRL